VLAGKERQDLRGFAVLHLPQADTTIGRQGHRIIIEATGEPARPQAERKILLENRAAHGNAVRHLLQIAALALGVGVL
jgi:hypothetical protein